MDALGFTYTTAQSSQDGYFEKFVVTTAYQTNSLEVYLAQLQDFLSQNLTSEVVKRRGMKIFPILHCVYQKPLAEELLLSVVPLPIKSVVFTDKSEVGGLVQEMTEKLKVRNENMLRLQSFLNLSHVAHLELHIASHNPVVTGSTYVELPEFLARRECIINVKNKDERCFGYAVLSAIFKVDRHSYPNLPAHYNSKFHWRGLDQLQYPIDIADIMEIEKKLEVGFNIFSFYDDEGRARYPLHICRQEFPINLDLLYWNGHYAWIKDFNRFMTDITKHGHRTFFCKKCLGHFTDELKQQEHSENCSPTEGMQQVLQLPSDPKPLKFRNYRYQDPIPFVIYADFECLVPETNKRPANEEAAFEYQHHIPCSVGLKLVSHGDALRDIPYKEHHGADCTDWLLDELVRLEKLCMEWLLKEERMRFWSDDRRKFQAATECYLCHKPFGNTPGMKKVRDHDHISGKYRGAAHSHCNLQMRKLFKIPVFFHNFRGYDSHLVVQSLKNFPLRKISVIGQAMEKYLSLSWGDNIVFKDSFQFQSSSLEQLVCNLLKSGKDQFVQLSKEFQGNPELFEMLLRKGVYPYDYMDSVARFDEPQLPPKDSFFSRLRDAGISDEEYAHAQHVWATAGCTRFADYHALYLKSMHCFISLVLLSIFITLFLLSAFITLLLLSFTWCSHSFS